MAPEGCFADGLAFLGAVELFQENFGIDRRQISQKLAANPLGRLNRGSRQRVPARAQHFHPVIFGLRQAGWCIGGVHHYFSRNLSISPYRLQNPYWSLYQ
jgi:hypothetical protein